MMQQFTLSERSLKNLQGVHPDLVAICKKALDLTLIDFGITEGLRSLDKQKEMVRTGKSQTMKSRHLTGHAVDVFAYPTPAGSWDFADYELISNAFKQAAKSLGHSIEWGGDWKSLKDGPHFQLTWSEYPV
ncbi:M15 family metallopeptidase [Yokenella regensburgei]